jgi:predicted dehydrogenase
VSAKGEKPPRQTTADTRRPQVVSHEVLIIGGGSIGERHLRCFLHTGRVQASLCDVSAEIRQRLEHTYDVAAVFDSFESIALAAYDTVVICTPANLHIPMATAAVEAGCNVLCEKPLSTTFDGIEALGEAIARTRVVFSVAYVFRAMPPMLEIKRRIDAGEIGQVQSVVCMSGQHFPTYRPAYREIYYRSRATGGGALQDAVTHGMNFIQWCLGPARSVYCEADHLVLSGVDIEDTASLILRFRDAPAIGTITLNQFQTNNSTVCEFAGTEGTLRVEFPPWRVGVCKKEQWTWSPQPAFERDDFFVLQAEAFLDAVEGKAAPACTLSEATDTLKTILAALRSADEGRCVEIS